MRWFLRLSFVVVVIAAIYFLVDNGLSQGESLSTKAPNPRDMLIATLCVAGLHNLLNWIMHGDNRREKEKDRALAADRQAQEFELKLEGERRQLIQASVALQITRLEQLAKRDAVINSAEAMVNAASSLYFQTEELLDKMLDVLMLASRGGTTAGEPLSEATLYRWDAHGTALEAQLAAQMRRHEHEHEHDIHEACLKFASTFSAARMRIYAALTSQRAVLGVREDLIKGMAAKQQVRLAIKGRLLVLESFVSRIQPKNPTTEQDCS